MATSGCSTPSPIPQAVPTTASPEGREDALSRTFSEDDVDYPAHPLAPIEPVYPPELRALGVEGQVVARVAVLADGSTAETRIVSSSHDAFARSVRESLRVALFHPAQRSGIHVASWVTLRLRFRLE